MDFSLRLQSVTPTYKEFAAIEEALADADDLAGLRAAKNEEHDAIDVPIEQVVDELGLSG
jgi:hypothetical protein